ncbi:MAG TPA: hypothetical protein VFX58_07980, partial [Chitinophagaceae bacterium]|nr:hypothetical protein [Chitinophagaceae bacterium]
MLLAIGPLTGFTGLLQILLWIVVGFLAVAFIITVFMHYRTKKQAPETDTLAKLVAANPESSGYKIDDKEYVFFDHSGLIREYKTKLVNNHARYTALKQDFEKLEDKYNSLLLNQAKDFPQINNMEMEQSNLPGAPALLWENEKNEWLKKEQELNLRLQRLEMENNILQEKLVLSTAGEEDRVKLVDEWKAENILLKSKLAEKEFSQDLVEEKKI